MAFCDMNTTFLCPADVLDKYNAVEPILDVPFIPMKHFRLGFAETGCSIFEEDGLDVCFYHWYD